jgi:hypothetical protein
MSDYRHRLLFVFGSAAAWYVSDQERLRAELEAFAADHFEDADRYSADHVASVVVRLLEDQHGIARIWHGHRVPNRYKLSNRYIIGTLEISGDEQRRMKTIIGQEERQRRRVARRRAQGTIERPIYLANAAEKRTRAVELRDATGMTHSQIAEEMGIPRGSVPALLRRETAPAFDAK